MLSLPRAAAAVPRLEVLESAPSTNTALAELAASGAAPFTVVVTDNQTAGRGRLDRTWSAPAGTSLAISALLPTPTAIGWLALAAGVAMVDAVAAALPERPVGLKWPNDVLVDGRKICGILAELTPAGIVLGAGLNTRMTADELPVPTATSLAVEGAGADADDVVLAAYLGALTASARALVDDPAASIPPLRAAATARCVTLGRTVRVELPGGRLLEGRAEELDDDGRLVVAAEDGRFAVAAGDVVHVR